MLDNVQTYFRDREHITQSLNTRLGLTESSLPGAQAVTVGMVQSAQLTTDIPNNLPHSIEIGESDDDDYQDNREYNLYQLDGTADRHTSTDQFADDEDIDSEQNKWKTYALADTKRKEMTRARQVQVLRNQQERNRAHT